MQITFKLYASLSHYLPSEAKNHAIKLTISDQETTFSVLDRFKIPHEAVHIVLLNGVYLQPDERSEPCFCDGDTLAAWPPVAGG